TQAPYLLPGAREGYRYGDGTLVDSCAHDALFCSFDKMAMGGATEKYAASAGIAREPQDEFAAKSHERAAAAIKDGKFADEIVPVEIPQRKGDPVLFDTDEGVRPGTTVEALASLRPAFDKAGNITAGNASQISDGASAVIVASKAKADELGVEPLGEIVGYGQVAGPDPSLLTEPSDQAGARGDRPLDRRRVAVRAERGVRRRRHRRDDRPRHHRRDHQRERRRDRARPPGRDVGQPARAHPAARAAPPRWRPRCGRAVRRWRPGRCHPAGRRLIKAAPKPA